MLKMSKTTQKRQKYIFFGFFCYFLLFFGFFKKIYKKGLKNQVIIMNYHVILFVESLKLKLNIFFTK